MSWNKKLITLIRSLFKEAWSASLPLIKITIPVVILVRIFQLIGLNVWVNKGLSPFIEFVGLPDEAGIVWASALVGNLYSAFIVFLSHTADLHLSIAQVTVLLTMVLVAHSLPMELRVTQMIGISPFYMGLLRLIGAIGLGWVLFRLYAVLGIYQDLAIRPAISVDTRELGWLEWTWSEFKNLVFIYLIVLALTLLMKLLRSLRIDLLLEYLFWPLNTILRVDRKISNFNVIGMIAGISYGSALMLQELKKNQFSHRDILVIVTFMSLAHGLIEETLLMVALGADWTGLLLGRVALACLMAMILSVLLKIFPRFLDRLYSNPG